jgi:hypothetical protein
MWNIILVQQKVHILNCTVPRWTAILIDQKLKYFIGYYTIPMSIVLLLGIYRARVVGYGPLSFCVIHKEGPSGGDINRLIMMMIILSFHLLMVNTGLMTSIVYA